MSDKTNIPRKDVTVPTLGNLSVPADFNLEKVKLTAETVTNYEKVFQTHRSFWDRVKLFLKAENQAGRYFEAITDFALIFVPCGRQIDNTTDFIRNRIFQSNKNTMAQLNEGPFQKAIRFLKQESTRRGIALVVGLVGGWLGFEFNPDDVIAAVISGVTGLSLVYAAWKNIRDIFVDEDG